MDCPQIIYMQNEKRPVRRVLVMIEYGEGDSGNGEVFDLTALMLEMLPASKWQSAQLSLTVEARQNIYTEGKPIASHISFGGYAGGDFISGASHLDDVVNAAMPDGFAVEALRKKRRRLADKVESMQADIMEAKLRQVAEIRHVRPIARFSEPLPMLPAVTPPTP